MHCQQPYKHIIFFAVHYNLSSSFNIWDIFMICVNTIIYIPRYFSNSVPDCSGLRCECKSPVPVCSGLIYFALITGDEYNYSLLEHCEKLWLIGFFRYDWTQFNLEQYNISKKNNVLLTHLLTNNCKGRQKYWFASILINLFYWSFRLNSFYIIQNY